MVSRKDIAKAANVSEAVVSYVTNKSNYVSAEKRTRVLQAIESLGYEPNYFARGLKTQKRDHISVISFLEKGDFLDETIYQFEKIAQNFKYSVSLSHVDKISTRHLQLIQSRSDGIIIFSDGLSDKDIHKLKEKNMPIVLVSMNIFLDHPDEISLVHINPELGIKQLFEYLSSNSCQSITYLTNSAGVKGRYKHSKYHAIFRTATTNKIRSEIVQLSRDEEITSDIAIDSFLKLGNFPDVFIVDSVVMAVRLISRAREMGYNVPQDFKVAAFGSNHISKYLNPPLTMISFDESKLAKLIIDELFKQIEDSTPFYTEIDTEANLRLSTS